MVQLTSQQMQSLQQLAQSPMLQNLRQQFQQNPQLIPQFLQALQQQNPQLYQLFSQNPNLFAAFLSGNFGTEGGEGFEGEEGLEEQGEVQLTEEDMTVIQSMMNFGFTQEQCIEAYLVCNKN